MYKTGKNMEYNEKSKIIFDRNKTYYFIGIGGINMSALAKILINKNYKIAGSDIKKTDITEYFEEKGYIINYNQIKGNIKDNYVIVKTDAILKDNEEYIQSIKLGLDIIPRALLLSYLSKKYDKSIAISGTHGKTTTTTMLSHILTYCGLDPTCVIGGIVPMWDSNLRIGKGNLFVYEACEAYNNLKYYEPDYLIITSIDADHLDYYGNLENLKNYFIEFINKVAKNGFVLLNIGDKIIKTMVNKFKGNIYFYSVGSERNSDTNLLISANIKQYKKNFTYFNIYINEKKYSIKIPVYGTHNIENVVSAIAIANLFINDIKKIAKSLENFVNPKRRFEYVGKFLGADVYNDYSHLPKEIDRMMEISKVLSTEKAGRIIIIFQPHLYSRTRDFYKEFAQSLSKADIIILVPIFPAREYPIKGVTSKLIYDELTKSNKKAHLFLHYFICSDLDEAKNLLKEIVMKNDVIITLGAGDIGEFYETLRFGNK